MVAAMRRELLTGGYIHLSRATLDGWVMRVGELLLPLLEREPGVRNVEVQAESERAPLASRTPRRPQHPGRQTLPPELPRVERVIPGRLEQCVCGRCGQPTAVIGYEESQQLDVEPAKYFVLVSKREKRACKACAEAVVAAPLPPRIIEKGLVSDRIVIDTVISNIATILRCTCKA